MLLLKVVSVLVGNTLINLGGCSRVVHVLNLNNRRQFLSLFEVLGSGLEMVWSVGSNVFDALVQV